MSNAIQTADLAWQRIDGINVPISKQFGDIYFSKDNGLLETRHVFLNGNDLPTRLENLKDFEYFCIGETGFGTGLNILALWQLWQNIRPNNNSHLHIISVEKFPLKKEDLIQALNVWPELNEWSAQLIEQYPLPIAGCHRLSFTKERFSIDLWLGDAHDIFPTIEKICPVNAWFLDGFAPSCNPDIWEENVLKHIVRLSDIGTTYSSFSVAGVLKRGLKKYGVSISLPRGFKHKREMLKAILETPQTTNEIQDEPKPIVDTISTSEQEDLEDYKLRFKQRQITIIGAGIAGLSSAWAFAQRGHKVFIYDQSAPLSGGSGNPLALLNPKLCPIEQSAEHLMTLAWQHAIRHYQKFDAFRPIQVNQLALKNEDDLLGLVNQYPEHVLKAQQSHEHDLSTEFSSLNLLHAGAISPYQLRDQILNHALIEFKQAEITQIIQKESATEVWSKDLLLNQVDHVIVCTARNNQKFFEHHPVLKPIRGQISWLNNENQPLAMHQAQSYGGYCMQLDTQHLILGASFYPNRNDTEVLLEDHVHNYNLIHSIFPEYAKILADISTWQGRASVRAQSQDYFPILGKLNKEDEIYSFAGLGSKGFLFAPLCSEILAAFILKEACLVPSSLVKKLSATRFQKKVTAKKPYFKPQQ